MKNQLNRILTTLFITGAILLFNGCSINKSPDNGNIYNQNTSNQNVSNKELSSEDKMGRSCNTESIEAALPTRLRKQLENGDFDLRYADNTLVIKGYVYGSVGILQQLLETVDNFRGNNCVKVVSFEGKTAGEDFKWCGYQDCRTKSLPSNGCNVITTIKNSKIKDQITKKNLSYEPNRGGKAILVLKGLIVGKSESAKFSSLFEEIQIELKGRCLSQIVLEAGEGEKFSTLSYEGFGWQLCQDSTQCECEDGCQPCVCDKGDGNTNTNVNTNTSNSNSP